MNIKELQERYSIASRSALYSRLKALKIILNKDSSGSAFASKAQIEMLDQLHAHINNGGNLKNFLPTTPLTVLSPQDEQYSTIVPNREGGVQSFPNTCQTEQDTQLRLDLFQDLMDVGVAIAAKIKSPIEHWKELNFAAENNILLSSSEIHFLTGAKPSGKEWIRGSFCFEREGKIGSQSAWRVERR